MIGWFFDGIAEGAHGLYWPVVEVPVERSFPYWIAGIGAVAVGWLYARRK